MAGPLGYQPVVWKSSQPPGQWASLRTSGQSAGLVADPLPLTSGHNLGQVASPMRFAFLDYQDYQDYQDRHKQRPATEVMILNSAAEISTHPNEACVQGTLYMDEFALGPYRPQVLSRRS